MDILDVLGSSETMRLLSNMRIPLVKKLSLNVATATSSINHGTLESINKILKNSPECRINRLIVNEYTIIIDPTVIEWSRLTLLHIGAPTNMDNALKIIAKLPNLVELMFYNFVPEAIPEEALALDKGSEFHSKLAPLNSTITKLMLGYDALDYSEDSVLAVIKYLSVRLELLSLFGAQVAFDTDMTEFVNGYSDIYPNLTNVTFRLGVTEIL
ncbi:hypothetical protein H4R24_000474 [Coemansia sp. RSA 988]|nr:hypothetical protein H4R24_000474 [Coemansia sp. RSA 988]